MPCKPRWHRHPQRFDQGSQIASIDLKWDVELYLGTNWTNRAVRLECHGMRRQLQINIADTKIPSHAYKHRIDLPFQSHRNNVSKRISQYGQIIGCDIRDLEWHVEVCLGTNWTNLAIRAERH